MKRNQERASDAERSESGATQVASVARPALSLVDPPLPEPRPAAQKAVARLAPKPAVRKKSAPTEAPAPQPDPPAIASEPPPLLASPPPPAQIEPEPRARPIIRVAGEVREWVADVAQASGRVAFCPACRIGPRCRRSSGARLLPAELILTGPLRGLLPSLHKRLRGARNVLDARARLIERRADAEAARARAPVRSRCARA